MKTVLTFLSALAVVLGIFTYFAVFGGSAGTYAVNPLPTGGKSATNTVLVLPPASGTPSSNGNGGTVGMVNATSASAVFSSQFATSPLIWDDDGATFSVTAASLENQKLSFALRVQMGASPACVPLNLRLVTDESGNLQQPNTPSFSFPASGDCNGAPGAAYDNQIVTFTIDPAQFPLLFTTGGAANVFFDVATTTANGLDIELPATSG